MLSSLWVEQQAKCKRWLSSSNEDELFPFLGDTLAEFLQPCSGQSMQVC